LSLFEKPPAQVNRDKTLENTLMLNNRNDFKWANKEFIFISRIRVYVGKDLTSH